MGKIRTRVIGDEEVEDKQKKIQKEKSERKKMEKKSDKGKVNTEDKKKMPELETTESEKDTETKVENKDKKSKKVKVARIRGSKYRKSLAKVDKKKAYKLEDAVELLKKISFTKFDSSFEIHLNLSSVGVKGEVSLPHSTGKTVRVAVVSDELLEKIADGVIEFDILVSHPSFMGKIAKHARILGPKGLMPNPKAGTVSTEPEKVAKKFESGSIRFKSEPKAPLLHQMIAKSSLDSQKVVENINSFIGAVGTKNIKTAFIKTTMSPALMIEIARE